MKKKKLKNKKLNLFFTTYIEDTLDFHKFGILTTYDIEKIFLEFIEDSYVKGYTNILVITGKGNVIRPLIRKLAEKNKYIEQIKTAGYFNGQEGAYEITLINT